MKSIRVIATNTFREIIRDRILYGIIVFALLLIGVSLALGSLSFAEQARISANFGFTGIQIATAILAVFVGSSLVSKEIDKQTILTLLVRPITRAQYLLGKFMGLLMVLGTVAAGLVLVLLGVVLALELKIVPSFFVAIYGVGLEAMILVSMALFFGTFARPMMTVIFTMSFFLIGHWVDSLDFFVQKSESASFKIIGKALGFIVPNLERFNWRAAPVYGDAVPVDEILKATFYGAGWVLFFLSATILIFRRKDFV